MPSTDAITAALAAVLRGVQSRHGSTLTNADACALRDVLFEFDAANELPWAQAREEADRV